MKQSLASLSLETKDSAPDGTFEGYGAVFGNTDRDGDIVAPGAFTDSLKDRLPALLWQHNAKEPIGRFDVVREDKKGLYVKGRLSTEGRGREAYDLLKMGALDGLSIGFVTKEAQRSRASGTRTITKADLMEVSLVTFPANEMARISTVKQRTDLMQSEHIEDPRSFERFLRDNGFSRSRAKAITAKGFRQPMMDASQEEILDDIVGMLRTRQAMFETKSGGAVRIKAGIPSSVYEFVPGSARASVSLRSIDARDKNDVIEPFDIRNFSTNVWFKNGRGLWQRQSPVFAQNVFSVTNPYFGELDARAKSSSTLRLQFVSKTQNVGFQVQVI